jgi:hypothetical protein
MKSHNMPQKFLSASWQKLIMANYIIDPSLLQPYLPACTELDRWEGKVFVSLVGFMFRNTKVLGVKIPFHIDFPEVNLRFYVRCKDDVQWKRGVVFIKEIVPKPAITTIANLLYGENYSTMQMKNIEEINETQLGVGYHWKHKEHWNRLEVSSGLKSTCILQSSEEEFITEHYWGYTKVNAVTTGEYKVAHPRWDVYPVNNFTIDCDFQKLYGKSFSILNNQQPHSVFLAEGSAIEVFNKRIIR